MHDKPKVRRENCQCLIFFLTCCVPVRFFSQHNIMLQRAATNAVNEYCYKIQPRLCNEYVALLCFALRGLSKWFVSTPTNTQIAVLSRIWERQYSDGIYNKSRLDLQLCRFSHITVKVIILI